MILVSAAFPVAAEKGALHLNPCIAERDPRLTFHQSLSCGASASAWTV